MSQLRDYYLLTKPGIIRGNIVATLAGFFLAARGDIDITVLTSLVTGLSLVIASACVFNNILDRSIDTRMIRTKKRAIAARRISVRVALIYGVGLGLAGFGLLQWFTTYEAVVFAVIAHFMYVVVYGYAKRKSPWGTLVGAVPGALPPVIGYVAVLGTPDIVSLGLFIILMVWQMPHFYAIAIFRKEDYKAAGIPVLSTVKSVDIVKKRMTRYIMVLLPVIVWFGIVAELSLLYTLISVGIILFWLRIGYKNRRQDDTLWAKKMFGASLFVLLTLCVVIALDASFI